MAWLNVHPEISHVVIAQHWSARYDSKNVMDWKLKPHTQGGNGKRPGKPYLHAAKIQGRSCRRASHP